MKELLKKAFANHARHQAKKDSSWQRDFLISVAEGYELNMLDLVTSGEQF